METELFNDLLLNYTSLSSEEAEQLAKLAEQYPYSQVIHNLAARSANDNNLKIKEKLLHTSAIYSTDRGALKSIMGTPRRARTEKRSNPVVSETESSSTANLSSDLLHEQLLADLALMQESKRHFEEVIEQMENGTLEPLPTTIKSEVPVETVKPAKGGEGIIDEIKSSKKKIKPEDPKQIEQIEIIDQFIKAQPTIPRTKSTPAPQPSHDLSEPSGLLGENIVSETLVEILLKQGKKEKAIEALKKLIWKFPQKKAYFAAQIEDLRK